MKQVSPMANMISIPSWSIIFMFTLNLYLVDATVEIERKVYIVYMGESLKDEFATESVHTSVLEQVLEGSSARESLVYSYRKSFNGFAAKLTEQEKQNIASLEGIVSVFPSKTLKLHTTRSWDFLGFSTTVKRFPTVESDVIVGLLDTGFWPESESFSDKGFSPPPSKWKGICQNITCNNKVIGARFYNSKNEYSSTEEKSPRDVEGHGSHTASTVAGVEVTNASIFGIANGTARGAVPSARIAIYKVCWDFGCDEDDVLAAFDDAISDGVDILSVSLGGDFEDYFTNGIAIGSFHAMKKGILTSASAGNEGPYLSSLSNFAPWMLSVAASSIDRKIIGEVALGNHKTLVGNVVNTFPTDTNFIPLVYGESAANETVGDSARSCDSMFLDILKVEGNIILCDSINNGPFLAGAHGTILIDETYPEVSDSFSIPADCLTVANGDIVKDYLNNTGNPVAKLYKSRVEFDFSKASVIATFSSRGPNQATPDILKPDISAPGVNILAAWSPKAKVSSYGSDERSVRYNIISGTSMACPHAAGAAAYVKTFNPSWSPAAIMSALITTAAPMNTTTSPGAEFAYGAGQIDPLNAIHPGLVYDAMEDDYIQMLCSQGYDDKKIKFLAGDNSSCPSKVSNGTVRELNYPSMAVLVKSGKHFVKMFPRTVTNVGLANSTYRATVVPQSGLNITVSPSVLSFKSLNEKLGFVVTVSGGSLNGSSVISSSLSWSDGKYSVTSPIVVYTKFSSSPPF